MLLTVLSMWASEASSAQSLDRPHRCAASQSSLATPRRRNSGLT